MHKRYHKLVEYMSNPSFLDPYEAADLTGLSVNTLNQYRSKTDGRGPVFLIESNRVFYPRSEVISWMNRRGK